MIAMKAISNILKVIISFIGSQCSDLRTEEMLAANSFVRATDVEMKFYGE